MPMTTTKSEERTAALSDETVLDSSSPFDREIATAPSRTQLTSDPPTKLVRRDSFHELLPGSIVGDNYEIDARIGAGAMGDVYAAHHMKLGKRVAIKVIGKRLSEDAAAMERFAMEAKTLAQIQHPAIVAVEHIGELADGRAYFVMEFLQGQTLFDRLTLGRVPFNEALRILDQMARGLEAAHAEGVVHRDLKPENTFLVHLPGELPTVKLVDFGLAKLRDDRAGIDQRAERTQSGVAIGTPMYMSPEQARGPDVDHRTDVYALGCVAYELLLGVPPFAHAKTTPELWAAHLNESPPLPSSIWREVPPQIDFVLFAMLAKDPAYRPTLAQLRSVIANLGLDPSKQAATEIVAPRAMPKSKSSSGVIVVAAIAVIALVLGITIGSRLSASKPDADRHEVSTPLIAPLVAPVDAAVQVPATPSAQPQTPPLPAEPKSTTQPMRPTIKPTAVKQPTPRTEQPATNVFAPHASEAKPEESRQHAEPDAAPKIYAIDRDKTVNPFLKKKASSL